MRRLSFVAVLHALAYLAAAALVLRLCWPIAQHFLD